MFSPEAFRRLADVAKLSFSDSELAAISKEVSRTLAMADKLHEVDTEGVQPTFYGNKIKNVMRPDEARVRGNRDQLLANAPDSEAGLIKVPAILESEEA